MDNVMFDDVDIVEKIESLDVKSIDKLPFGVVRLDDNGAVQLFNTTEAELSGYGGRPKLGRNFFTEIAPCMNSPEMRGRIEAARKAGAIDIELGWIGDFKDQDGELRIRALSASSGGIWLFVSREDE